MSTVRANQILDAAGGNTATINGMTPTAQSLQGFRNRIINGDMRIDQRNNGASVTTTSANSYVVDRFIVRSDTANGTAQRSSVAPSGFTNSLIFTAGTGSSPSAAQVNTISQRIEGFNIADLAWGTASAVSVPISFWVRSSVTGTFAFRIGNGSRSYVATYTVNSANTFEYKTIVIPGDTSGTWATDNSVGMFLNWDLGSGSSLNAASANTWVATDSVRVVGSVNLVATSGATFYITGVQLEAGSVATPFERRDYGRELALCQRYYQKTGASWVVWAAAGVYTVGWHQVTMRATPTATGGGAGYSYVGDGNYFRESQTTTSVQNMNYSAEL